jgi:hypothetical protein
MALLNEAEPKALNFEYGTAKSIDNTAWDYKTLWGCVCDSSWSVGLGDGQVQLSEYFGPDCSLKRCPSGDDPFTHVDETNCHGKNQEQSIMMIFIFYIV